MDEEPTVVEEIEIVDGLPVLAEVRELEPVSVGPMPVIQTAAVAATGFVAGAATFALLKRRGMRRLAQQARLPYPTPMYPWLPGTSRTYLVNVRVISRPPE